MPSLGIAPHPEGCASQLMRLAQDAAPVIRRFPVGVQLHLLEIVV
jgi:hypothetical protein